MSIRRPSRSLSLALVGGGAFALGLFVRFEFSLGALEVQPGPIIGAVVALGALGVAVLELKQPAEPEEVVPAHVAFLAPPPRTAESPPALVERVEAPTMPRPPPPPLPALTPDEVRKRTLESEIRDLSKQINRAGVMLATGKLSEGGYTQYVEDLKRRRGKLEADRLALELKN